MNSTDLIEQFYKAFAEGNSKEMVKHYHKDIVFKDPAFGILKGERAGSMWKMLLSSKNSASQINFSNIKVHEENGSAEWVAKYNYGPKNRKVTNHVKASFKFKEGKIIEHTDHFNLWKWTQQALGPAGYLLGWSSFMKNKIQSMTKQRLDAFIGKSS